MLSSGFSHSSVSRILVYSTVAVAVVATATDTKYYFPLSVGVHIVKYGQWWRLVTWQLCYINSIEVLFAAMTFYQLRVIERLWGSDKFLSFLVMTLPFNTLLPPLLVLLLRPLTWGKIEYLPSGPTAIVFSVLAQYHAMVPYLFRYRISSSASSSSSSGSGIGAGAGASIVEPKGIELTSKSWSYLLPVQLAFSQLPGSLVSAFVGWCVGYAWRLGVLPGVDWRWGRGATRTAGLTRRSGGDITSASSTSTSTFASTATTTTSPAARAGVASSSSSGRATTRLRPGLN